MAEEKTEQDIVAVQEFIKSQVKAAFDELSSQVKPEISPVQIDQDQGRKQLREIINPIIGPDIDQARLLSASALDESRFYRKNPDAAEYEEQIEKIFEEEVKKGRPTSRETIHNFLLGQEIKKDPEAFVARREEKKRAELERLNAGVDFGAVSYSKGKDAEAKEKTFREFDKLSVEEMREALEGVVF